jgi:hypothetical protein
MANQSNEQRLVSLSLSDIVNMTLMGDESFYRCEVIDAEFASKDAEIERLREGLQRIAKFNCHPVVDANEKAWQESQVCPECKRARDGRYGNFCDTHYRSVILDREKRQEHAEVCVKYEMKDIAVAVLRGEPLPALKEVAK